MESGSVMYNRERPALSTVEGLQKAKQLARRLNCDEYDYKWLDCLRAIDDPNLFIETPENGNIIIMTHAVFGTEFLPLLPQKAFETGLYNSDIELIAGATKDEGPSLADILIPEIRSELTVELFVKAVRDLSREYHNIDVEEVCNHYLKGIDKTNSSQLKAALSALYGDLVMTCPTYLFAKSYAKYGQNVEEYGCDEGYVCHGADMVFVYGFTIRNQHLFTENDYDFSIDIMKIWTDFAKTGKPHNVWPQLVDKSVIRVKDLNPNDMSLILDNPYESTCDGIWKHYF
ncbi:unnamed protein product, partial [Medioppia subpectinata]